MTKYKENISILLHIVTENSIENGIYKKYIIKKGYLILMNLYRKILINLKQRYTNKKKIL